VSTLYLETWEMTVEWLKLPIFSMIGFYFVLTIGKYKEC